VLGLRVVSGDLVTSACRGLAWEGGLVAEEGGSTPPTKSPWDVCLPCHDREGQLPGGWIRVHCPHARCYPSDVADSEWEVLGPEAEQVMAELRGGRGGRAVSQ